METVRYADLFPHEVTSQRCHRRWSELWARRRAIRFEPNDSRHATLFIFGKVFSNSSVKPSCKMRWPTTVRNIS